MLLRPAAQVLTADTDTARIAAQEGAAAGAQAATAEAQAAADAAQAAADAYDAEASRLAENADALTGAVNAAGAAATAAEAAAQATYLDSVQTAAARDAAQGHAQTASESATESAQAATAAQTAATTASTQAGIATAARTEAQQHAEAADDARDDAVQASVFAGNSSDDALASAQQAQASATAATGAASTATAQATQASTGATTATTQAGIATAARTEAQQHADAAQQHAENAEAGRDATQALVDSVAGLNAPHRLLLVDAAFAGSTDGFTFGDVAVALTAAEALIATEGGRVTLRLYHDGEGEPVALPAPHTAESLRAEGIDVETAGQSGDGNAARFAAHVLGWWLGHHPLSEAVLAETGHSVNLDALPFPMGGSAPSAGSAGPVAWDDVTGKPPILPVNLEADGGYGPNPAWQPHGLVQIDPDDTGRHVWVVHKSQAGDALLDLTGAAWERITGRPTTFAPAPHTHAEIADLQAVVDGRATLFDAHVTTVHAGSYFSTSGHRLSTPISATAAGATLHGRWDGVPALAQGKVHRWRFFVRPTGTTADNQRAGITMLASPSTAWAAELLYNGTTTPGYRIRLIKGAAEVVVANLPAFTTQQAPFEGVVTWDGAALTFTATACADPAVTTTVTAAVAPAEVYGPGTGYSGASSGAVQGRYFYPNVNP